MKKIMILCVIMLPLVQAVRAQPRESGPELFFKKNNVRIGADRQVSASKSKLLDPIDNSKAVDFSIRNIDIAGLRIVKQEVDKKYGTLLVVVKNDGLAESNQAYVAMMVWSSGGATVKSGFLGTSGKKVIYSDGMGVPKLKPGEEIKIWFDPEKSGYTFAQSESKSIFSNLFKGAPGATSYWIECVLVSEPIIIK